jgi:hypothetical protein
MRRLGVAVTFLTLILGTDASAQSETAAPLRSVDKTVQQNSRVYVVKGRALFDDTGQPAPRVRVQLVAIELLVNRSGPNRIPTTMTNANGEFVFVQASVGEYYVVGRPADEHGPSAQGAPFPLQTGDLVADAARLAQFKKDYPRIKVNAGSPVEINLRVKNPHFGEISGRIVSANGGVAAGADVHLMKTGERGFGLATVTDENGAYRFRGLPAGEYVLSADSPRKISGAERSLSSPGLLGATYYPSTIDSRTSPLIVVSPDREVIDMNVTLVDQSLHSVRGALRGQGDGHPIAGATVRLYKKDWDQTGIEAAMSNYFATTDAQGHWLFSNLPDGVYTIDIRPTGLLGSKLERFVAKRQDLVIAGADVEDLAIDVLLGGRVSGHVTVEQGTQQTRDISIGLGSAFGRVEANGDFNLTGVPEGEFPLAVMIRPQNVFYAKSIQVNGVDLLREKLKITAGEEINDVHVVIGPASVLTGRVLSASDGTPLSRVSVMLIAADPSTARAFSRPNGSTDEQGVFVVSGAPGDYFLVLWARGERLPPRDVDSIKRLAPNTLRITLVPGERKSMDVVK